MTLSLQGPLLESINTPREQRSTCGVISYPKQLEDADVQLFSKILDGQHDHWKEVSVSDDDACRIEKETRGQGETRKWHEERRNRLTASNFGAIMTRQKEVSEIFMKNTFNTSNLQTKPTSYGHVNEKVAKNVHEQNKLPLA